MPNLHDTAVTLINTAFIVDTLKDQLKTEPFIQTIEYFLENNVCCSTQSFNPIPYKSLKKFLESHDAHHAVRYKAIQYTLENYLPEKLKDAIINHPNSSDVQARFLHTLQSDLAAITLDSESLLKFLKAGHFFYSLLHQENPDYIKTVRLHLASFFETDETLRTALESCSDMTHYMLFCLATLNMSLSWLKRHLPGCLSHFTIDFLKHGTSDSLADLIISSPKEAYWVFKPYIAQSTSEKSKFIIASLEEFLYVYDKAIQAFQSNNTDPKAVRQYSQTIKLILGSSINLGQKFELLTTHHDAILKTSDTNLDGLAIYLYDKDLPPPSNFKNSDKLYAFLGTLTQNKHSIFSNHDFLLACINCHVQTIEADFATFDNYQKTFQLPEPIRGANTLKQIAAHTIFKENLIYSQPFSPSNENKPVQYNATMSVSNQM